MLLKTSNIISNYAEKSQAAVIKQQFKVLMVKSPFFKFSAGSQTTAAKMPLEKTYKP